MTFIRENEMKGEDREKVVQMAVKVDDCDGAVSTVHAAKEWQRDGMVPAQGDDAGERSALDRRPLCLSIGGGFTREDDIMPFLNLLKSIRVIISSLCQCRLSFTPENTHDVTGMSPQSRIEAQL